MTADEFSKRELSLRVDLYELRSGAGRAVSGAQVKTFVCSTLRRLDPVSRDKTRADVDLELFPESSMMTSTLSATTPSSPAPTTADQSSVQGSSVFRDPLLHVHIQCTHSAPTSPTSTITHGAPLQPLHLLPDDENRLRNSLVISLALSEQLVQEAGLIVEGQLLSDHGVQLEVSGVDLEVGDVHLNPYEI